MAKRSIDVLNVLEWKTAYYTFVNPLQLGAILAGANDAELESLAEYGVHAGRTFQITDDILGIFSTASESGKSPLDDIKEGKRTLMAVYALEHATKPDAYFLEQALGNQNLTMAEFEHCKRILTESGALAYARETAAESANAASQVIVKNSNWPQNTKQFLLELVQYLVDRKS
jgi:geranylgeranyl pyrophosphate synthase